MAESYEQTDLEKARDLAIYFFHCLIYDEEISSEDAEQWSSEYEWLGPVIHQKQMDDETAAESCREQYRRAITQMYNETSGCREDG